jgi:hypothetical protein
MVGLKGGKCVSCSEKVTHGNIENFHFDHKTQLNNHADKTDRWGGAIRDWPPFTDRWIAWAQTVDLICRECHEVKHSSNGVSLFSAADLAEVQQRLARVESGPIFTTQISLDL